MPSTAARVAASSVPAPARAPRLLSVEIRETPDVLPRILTLLLRRRCTVTRVDFIAHDRHRPGRLVLGYDAPALHADRTADWLRALVDVLIVESLEP